MSEKRNETGRVDVESLPEVEGDGQSRGVPAGETLLDHGDTTGDRSRSHWKASSIIDPDLNARGSVFFAAVEMTRMPMILTDPNQADNPIVFANRAFLDLTGYETDEIVGRNCRFLQGAMTDRETVTELREAVAGRQSVSVEILNYKRDGTPFWNAVFIGPVYDLDGELLFFFASQLDVTRRRGTEQALRQAQKMEAVGQLTAGLAHDFNNLLQVVNGNLELALSRLQDEGVRRQLEQASAAAERGAKLTRQLLAFARKTRLEPKPADLSATVAEFGDLLESTLGAQVALRLDLRRRLPACLVDRTHLEMALLNVAVNARDALPDGGTVTVSTEILRLNGDAAARHLAPGDYVVLAVSDDGPGMPPHVLERATEPFFTTKGVGKGTGLGLAMVHGFVQQSRGRLEIDSAPGRGTTIRMIFPIGDRPAREVAPPRRFEAASFADTVAGGAERILVVEDNEDVLALAREHLSSLGYHVLTAASGEEALKLLDSGQVGDIDLLFSDIVMPGGVNGLVLAEEFGRRMPQVPVLLATGYNDELAVDAPRHPSTVDVLGKPYKRSELADRIRSALNRRNADETPRRRMREFGAAEG